MGNRLATPLRLVLAITGGALVLAAFVTAVLVPSAILLAVAALLIGALLFAWSVNGSTVESVSMAKGEAKFRAEDIMEAIQEEVTEPVVVRPDPVLVKLEVPEPEVSVGPPPTPEPTAHHRMVEDTVKVTDSVEAKVTTAAELKAQAMARWQRLRREAAETGSPRDFARLILRAIEEEKALQPGEEYWSDHRHVGGEQEAYHLTVDFRGLADDSFRVGEQAQRIAEQTYPISSTLAGLFTVLGEAARARADSLPFGGPATVLVITVGGEEGEEHRLLAERPRAAALASEVAAESEPSVAAFWKEIARQLGDAE